MPHCEEEEEEDLVADVVVEGERAPEGGDKGVVGRVPFEVCDEEEDDEEGS